VSFAALQTDRLRLRQQELALTERFHERQLHLEFKRETRAQLESAAKLELMQIQVAEANVSLRLTTAKVRQELLRMGTPQDAVDRDFPMPP